MISVVILTKNSQITLKQALDALIEFDEIILYDTGSTDNTLNIAKQYSNVRVFEGQLKGFGPTRNLAARLASHDWILSIDSDEIVSDDLVQEIFTQSLDARFVFSIPFHNYYNKRWVKWCGWYPEEHIRLYHRHKAKFSDAMVHEGIHTESEFVRHLQSPIYHYSYHSISDFLGKMQKYSDLFAAQYQGKKKSSPFIAFYHGVGAFLKSFFLKRGFLGGYEGFLISAYNAHTAFYKYLKLYELNQKKEE